MVQFMPFRDPPDNSIIQYVQMGKWDSTKYTVHEACRSILFVNEILLLRFLKFFARTHYHSYSIIHVKRA